MSGTLLTRPSTLVMLALLTCGAPFVSAAHGQATPRPAPAPPSRGIDISGYAMAGRVNLTAADSFDAILGTSHGPIFGGGARVGLPFGGLFVDVGAWRFRGEGERVFVSNGTVFPLDIPVEITMTPIEVSAGWRFRLRGVPRLTPYVGGGVTSMRYRETSDFSTPAEDVDQSFNGFHLLGGAEVRILRWLGAAGEVAWTTIPDAIGEGGASQAFDEDNLGGTTFRFKVTIGR